MGDGFLFGLPVKISTIVPRDEVWLRTEDDLVRLVNLANAEEVKDAEIARLRSALEAAERGRRDALHDLGIELGARREAEAAVERLTRERDRMLDEAAKSERRVCIERDAARAEVERLTRERNEARRFMLSAEKAYCGSAIMLEVMGFFDAAGCGQPGTPNTLWSMTQEIIASRDAARAEAGAAYAKGVEDAAAIADKWEAQYPPDVFPPESTSLDAKAAGHGRHVAKMIAEDARALAAGGKHGG